MTRYHSLGPFYWYFDFACGLVLLNVLIFAAPCHIRSSHLCNLQGRRVPYTVAPLTGFLGILFCRFPFFLLRFLVTSCTHTMHMPLHPPLVLSLFALNALPTSKPTFLHSKILLKNWLNHLPPYELLKSVQDSIH